MKALDQKFRRGGHSPLPLFLLWGAALLFLITGTDCYAYTFTVVDTGLSKCYDNTSQITCPSPGQSFYGQDSQYTGNASSYRDNGDGTITDLNTGLMWQQGLNQKMTYDEAAAAAGDLNLAGYNDWRLPTIKELYSLIQFYGSTYYLIPYLDTTYFDFEWGDAQGERVIDSQFWSGTEYVGAGSDQFSDLVFGVNFADGRIKGYPGTKDNYVRYVRGTTGYGDNNFIDIGDDTITDLATGLMWQKGDSGRTMVWKDALAYAENLELAGHGDWRLPNAKELQSIVDYTRAPDARDGSAVGPAIDPIFELTETESWYWSSTTHLDGRDPSVAVYIAFGMATGYDDVATEWINVHGAGAQRSDPKDGDPDDYPYGRGPQGDEIRIFNYVRCVRDASTSSNNIAYDFNGDQNPDILYRNPESGKSGVWLMDGTAETSWTYIGNHGVEWDIKGVGDFDGDGWNDVLYSHSGGNTGVWLMNQTNESTWRPLTDSDGAQPANHGVWEIKGAADFNNDRYIDVVYRNPDNGNLGVWLMNGVSETSWVYIGNHGVEWDVKAMGDLDNNGSVDILYGHPNGSVGAWLMNGVTETAWKYIGNHGDSWEAKGLSDLDGDGYLDVVYRNSSGSVGVWLMNGTTETGWKYIGNHGSWDIR